MAFKWPLNGLKCSKRPPKASLLQSVTGPHAALEVDRQFAPSPRAASPSPHPARRSGKDEKTYIHAFNH